MLGRHCLLLYSNAKLTGVSWSPNEVLQHDMMPTSSEWLLSFLIILGTCRRSGWSHRFPCLEHVNIPLWGFASVLSWEALRCYLFCFIYCSILLFVDLICFFSPTKGSVGKDTSCRWVIDDSLLFSVCALWFYLLCFKGPKWCTHWDLILV